MKPAYIVSAKRTAIGTFGGTLQDINAVDLGAANIKAAIRDAQIDVSAIDEVIIGNVLQAGVGMNPSRQSAIKAGIPVITPSFTVNKVCGSGMKSIMLAAQSILTGDNNIVIAGGFESMDNAPYLLKKARTGYKLGHGELLDHMVYDGLTDIFNNYHMGITAENLADKYKITREQQDDFALQSQKKAKKAIGEGKFKDEIIPFEIKDKKGNSIFFDQDEHPRDTTIEKLASLKPSFKKDGTVTAGNASGINDGSAILIVASEEAIKRHNLKPIAVINSYASGGVAPEIMGIGPVTAIRNIFQKTSLKMSDIGLWELNEAFAVQSLSVLKELPDIPADMVNVNGGAIALGHPIGASGARIVVTLLHEMMKQHCRYGLASLCIGGGQGTAMIVERI